ncbi:MAG TPA: hypothetical protein VHD85_08595 [Terracidiphilus sp.]|nr:hypothetical protein [Terracidiphilus sp.]
MTFGQSSASDRPTKVESQTDQITKFFIGQPAANSAYETGSLHIIYSDGTDVAQVLPPFEPSTDKEVFVNAVGFTGVVLAQDGQTLGWEVNFDAPGQSYSIPLSVVVFRHKKVLHSFGGIQMIWDWMFVKGGNQVAIVSGPTHGPEIGDYRLYDVRTGKLVSEVFGDEDTQSLKLDAPEWAKQLEDHLHKRSAP